MNEIEMGTYDALMSAKLFLDGWDRWNMPDEVLNETCSQNKLDADLVYLTSRVLFGPAVIALSTNKPLELI